MNLIVLTGKLKGDITLKNKVAMGTINCDGTFFDLVAFKNKADEAIKFKDNQHVIVHGELRKRKYNDKYYYNIVVSQIDAIAEKAEPLDTLDNSEIIEDGDEIKGLNLDGLNLDDDDTPF